MIPLEISRRRLKAAERAIQKQKEKYSLFDWAGTAIEQGFVDPSPEERIEKITRVVKEAARQRWLLRFRNIKDALLSIPEFKRKALVKFFKDNTKMPRSYFPGWLRSMREKHRKWGHCEKCERKCYYEQKENLEH